MTTAEHEQTREERKQQVSFYKVARTTVLGICVASGVYFADILLRASEKYFWFDELFTIYLCRLAGFKSTWTAVSHGADFNPPLFYLLIRGAQHLFGEGLIGTRVPAMIGVWIGCLGIFLFVFRRNGPFAGFIAAALPFFTLVNYYAYEARPHGIVLGWAGLALIFWQRAKENRRRTWWVAGFALAIAGGLMTHEYAIYILVPFIVVELYGLVAKRRLDWSIVAAMGLPLLFAVIVYLPMIRMYKATMPPSFFPATRFAIANFYQDLFGPGIWVLVLLVVVVAIGSLKGPATELRRPAVPRAELLLAIAFVGLPCFGFFGAKLTHGAFISRYFLSSILGFALLLGFAFGRPQIRPRVRLVAAACLFAVLVGVTGSDWIHRLLRHPDGLMEPSTGLNLNTDLNNPLRRYSSLGKSTGGLDIAVVSSLEYIYLFRYAPPVLANALHYVATVHDVNLGGYRRLMKETHVPLKIDVLPEFLKNHNSFMVYAPLENAALISPFVDAGYDLKAIQTDSQGVLFKCDKQ
jgi:hypothetical protein